MRVLVVGSGGREHALVWKLSQSARIDALFCAPGNGGISKLATCVDIEPIDVEGLVGLVKRERVDLVVVGPESALAVGVADAFDRVGVRVFGPSRLGAQIETSKVFAKVLMENTGFRPPPSRRSRSTAPPLTIFGSWCLLTSSRQTVFARGRALTS